MAAEDVVRTGLCLVRAELDRYAGVRITVTVVADLDRSVEQVCCCSSADAALERVRAFLVAFPKDGG
jgi:hypothetical protein